MSTAIRILGDSEDARDASQEAFVRIYRHLSSIDPTRRFSTWLYRVVVNCCYDFARSRARRPRAMTLDDLPPGDQPRACTAAGCTDDLQSVVLALADELTIDQRTAFVLRDVEERSTRETANIMDCPEGTVRSHLHRARSHLRTMLTRRFPELIEGWNNEV